MSKSTISTFQLFEMFPDAEAARVYMEAQRRRDLEQRRRDLEQRHRAAEQNANL